MLKNKVLIVDDCESTLKFIHEFLLDMGVPETMILSSSEPMKALELFNNNKDEIELVISDNYMPNSSGLEFCEVIKSNNPKTLTMIFSGDVNLLNRNAPHIDHILMKPDGLNQLESILSQRDEEENRIQVSIPNAPAPKITIERISKAEFIEVRDESCSLKGLLLNRLEDGCSLVLPMLRSFIHNGKIYSLQLKDSNLDVGPLVSAKSVEVDIIDEELAKVQFKFIA